ncbi:hypothetical protein M2480_000385 [Parabacteroides sp. PFB2-12]|uniref:Spi family protease inhibitor n=1 Tax=unclassified Parabacteroides TaxID=2649774 RepID=UPI0024738ED7|nr:MULTISPECIES: Spi family protease inhibitor [unclassified Parabacteroides]MDH6341235.1 hypothetical protein [Parabacteroides sp. PM6-13]MDH6389425.1 hypothetical protein [Parabacteroides sp. PFB2-12]
MKTNVLKFLALSFIFNIFTTSCSENEHEYISDTGLPPSVNSYRVSIEDAKKELTNFITSIDQGSSIGTKGYMQNRKIKNIEVVKSDHKNISSYITKSNTSIDIDTLLYIMNFDDEQGFAIVSADKRTAPVYALINEGYFSMNDIEKVNNPGFIIFMEEAIKKTDKRHK